MLFRRQKCNRISTKRIRFDLGTADARSLARRAKARQRRRSGVRRSRLALFRSPKPAEEQVNKISYFKGCSSKHTTEFMVCVKRSVCAVTQPRHMFLLAESPASPLSLSLTSLSLALPHSKAEARKRPPTLSPSPQVRQFSEGGQGRKTRCVTDYTPHIDHQ